MSATGAYLMTTRYGLVAPNATTPMHAIPNDFSKATCVQDQLIQTLRSAFASVPAWNGARFAPLGNTVSPVDKWTVGLVHFGHDRHVYVSLLPELEPSKAMAEAFNAHTRCLVRRSAWAQEMVVVPQLQTLHPIVLTRRVGIANLDSAVLLECLGALARV